MKTFKDLEFNPHPIATSGLDGYGSAKQAICKFDNGYWVSVVFGSCFYSNGVDTYEVAILGSDGAISYNTGITSDVIGHIDSDEVTEVMAKVQLLPNCK